METLIKRSFFVLAATTLTLTTLQAQTADDIVNKYVTAIGGKDAMDNTHSLIVEATTSFQGNDADTKITSLYGKGYKSESNFGGTPIVTCITPTGGWSINQFTNGTSAATALPADQLKGQKSYLTLNPLANYATMGEKIELAGQDSADYKIKATGDGPDVLYYVNMKTYLLDKVVTHVSAGGQDADVTISFSDYRKLDNGLLFPYAENLDLPQVSLTITVKKVTVNPTVDPTVFDMPKS